MARIPKIKTNNTLIVIIVALVVLTLLYWLFESMKHNVHESFYASKPAPKPTTPKPTPKPTTPKPTPKPTTPKPRPTTPMPLSQADCTPAGLIFKENKCIPPENQDDCTFNLYGSIYNQVAKNCLGKITRESCSENYRTSVYKYKDFFKDNRTSCIENIPINKCKEKNGIIVKDMYNQNACRSPLREKDCNTYLGEIYYDKQCRFQIDSGPGFMCNSQCGEPKFDLDSELNKKCIKPNDNYWGICSGVNIGGKCKRAIECQSNICINGVCQKGGAYSGCENDNQCINNRCKAENGTRCSLSIYGEKCYRNTDCESNNCNKEGKCDLRLFDKDVCFRDYECVSGECKKTRCTKKK